MGRSRTSMLPVKLLYGLRQMALSIGDSGSPNQIAMLSKVDYHPPRSGDGVNK